MPLTKLLLVDDDEDDRFLFMDALKEIDPGLKCDIAENGIEALEYLHTDHHKPDIIFLDLNMPKMNGFECLKAVKNDSSTRDIPIIIFTTSHIDNEKQRAVSMGAKKFFSKPGDFTVLKKDLLKILKSEFKDHEFAQ